MGHTEWWRRRAASRCPARIQPYLRGPFGFQADNGETRRFEYPWAYHATPLSPGLRVVEVGGSLSGLQFVLAKTGLTVVNVDPGESAEMGWPLDIGTFEILNRAFGTNVELKPDFLADADFAADSIDRVFIISTLEHIRTESIADMLDEVRRILRPGGFCVLTVDLFLDLMPFTDRESNESGHNVDIAWMVSSSGLEMVQGDRAELYGFPEFDPRHVLEGLSRYLYGSGAPALSQALVLQKSPR
jgi:SAM-dependent methyltransferase